MKKKKTKRTKFVCEILIIDSYSFKSVAYETSYVNFQEAFTSLCLFRYVSYA